MPWVDDNAPNWLVTAAVVSNNSDGGGFVLGLKCPIGKGLAKGEGLATCAKR